MQINISASIDAGHVADSLRELANFIEEYSDESSNTYPRQYESATCVAELTTEE